MNMLKKAAIIATQSSLGSSHTAKLWHQYLLSSIGGHWKELDIELDTRGTRSSILKSVQFCQDADYAIVIFCGTGTLETGDLPWEELKAMSSDSQVISEDEFNPNTPSCTLIFDCETCTSPAAPIQYPESHKIIEQIRQQYDSTISKAERGLAKLYAIGTNSQSLTFSQHLLQACATWSTNNRGILTISRAVEMANKTFTKTPYQQPAEYHCGRRVNDFPIAISTQ
jgi:hypothetical protein